MRNPLKTPLRIVDTLEQLENVLTQKGGTVEGLLVESEAGSWRDGAWTPQTYSIGKYALREGTDDGVLFVHTASESQLPDAPIAITPEHFYPGLVGLYAWSVRERTVSSETVTRLAV